MSQVAKHKLPNTTFADRRETFIWVDNYLPTDTTALREQDWSLNMDQTASGSDRAPDIPMESLNETDRASRTGQSPKSKQLNKAITNEKTSISSPFKRKRLREDDPEGGQSSPESLLFRDSPPRSQITDHFEEDFTEVNRKKPKKKKKQKVLCEGPPLQGNTGISHATSARGVDTSQPLTESQENQTTQQPLPPANTHTHTKQRPRRKLLYQPKQPPPSFLEFPVVVQDLKEGPATLQGLGLRRKKTFDLAIGEVKEIRMLAAGSVLVGCSSASQQNKLLRLDSIGGIKVKCHRPEVTTEGVIKRIPTIHSGTDLSEMAVGVRVRMEDGSLVEKGPSSVRSFRRLLLRDGKPSQAVRVTFTTAILPDSVVLESEVYGVEPYTPPVRRCTKCQRLSHLKQQCKSKVQICPRCGSKGHDGATCTKAKHCVNCKGEHSAAYLGCPEMRLRLQANKIRSAAYIPYSEALDRARRELAKQQNKTATAPAEMRDSFWRPPPQPIRRTSTPRSGYSLAVQRPPLGGQVNKIQEIKNKMTEHDNTLLPVHADSSAATAKHQTTSQNPNPGPQAPCKSQTARAEAPLHGTPGLKASLLRKAQNRKEDSKEEQLFERLMGRMEEGLAQRFREYKLKTEQEIKQQMREEQEKAELELADAALDKLKTGEQYANLNEQQRGLQGFIEQCLGFMVKARQMQSPLDLIDSLSATYTQLSNTKVERFIPGGATLALGALAGAKQLSVTDMKAVKTTF